MGAFLNVKINAAEIEDKAWMENILKLGAQMCQKGIGFEHDILKTVEKGL
ncbi:MAG: hypothetical protein IH986_12610 [Planctomycetes bacterium]|nr:hypothetical protein [Planctomycetota bacterium]